MSMTQIYFWPTPNGYKVLIAIEELGIPCDFKPIDITKGDQHSDSYKSISPFGLIPALIDTSDDGKEIKIFESGAILYYLAEKHNALLPDNKWQCLSWLFWQVSSLGPSAGQSHHFHHYSPVDVKLAKDRFKNETLRLYKVLDHHLQSQKTDYISSKYSIADIACYPWINSFKKQGLKNLDDFPNLSIWYDRINKRTAVKTAYSKVANIAKPIVYNEKTKKTLFGNSAIGI